MNRQRKLVVQCDLELPAVLKIDNAVLVGWLCHSSIILSKWKMKDPADLQRILSAQSKQLEGGQQAMTPFQIDRGNV